MVDDALRARREATVLEHMEAERVGDFERVVATFSHPRYEVLPTGDTYDGAPAVLGMFAETSLAFPGFCFENVTLYHSEAAVIVEADFVGRHLGPYRGLPATGRSVRYRMCNVFVFDGPDLTCERLHFDLHGVLIQLGIARDPVSVAGKINTFFSHPLVVLGAVFRGLFGSR